jgi:UTP--glucose-1-phosphate uridylyltransferase
VIKKAIIPAAGYGTRSLPITKVLPKEMFPIGVKPAIHYVVEEAMKSGIEQILMVVSRKKNMIVDYFDHSLELEAFLEKENKQYLLANKLIPDIEIHYVRQPYAKGLGDAVKLGKSFVGNDPFAILLPDDLVFSKESPGLKQLMDVYEREHCSVLGLNKVSKNLLKNYGVIKGSKKEKDLFDLENIIEKPKNNPPSQLAVIGRYIFTPAIFGCLDHITDQTKTGEIQLTDAIKEMLAHEKCLGKIISGKRFDIGSTSDYLKLINQINELNKE